MNEEEYYQVGWQLTIHCDIHNNRRSRCIALPHFRQLDDCARDMIKLRAHKNDLVGNIHTALLGSGYANVIKRDIQNLMNHYRLLSLDGMTPIQALLHLLETHII
jgi:hypothetical protein